MTDKTEKSQSEIDIALDRLNDARKKMRWSVSNGCDVTSAAYQRLQKTVAALGFDYRWEQSKQANTSNEARVHVYHSYRQGCWVVKVFDENGYPSPTELVDRKPLAVDMAIKHNLPVNVFARGGLFQRRISNKPNMEQDK